MKNRHLYSYLKEVTTADIVFDTSFPQTFSFNQVNSLADYFNKIIHKEIQITAQLNHLIREAERSQDIKDFLIPYIGVVEKMFTYTDTGTYTHRHLRISPPPDINSSFVLPPGFDKSVSDFIKIQLESLLRVKTLLAKTPPAPQLEYQFNDTTTDLLEGLNIIWETKAVTPKGNKSTKSAFISAVFRLLGLTLPDSFYQQIAQTTRRHNPVKYLDEVRKRYIRYLHETRGK